MSSPTQPTPLDVVALSRAVVYPAHPSDNPHRVRYGVVRDDGTVVESTIDDRHHGEHTFIAPDPDYFDVVDVDTRSGIYAGPLYDVYGHFIIESCQRLWWAHSHPELPIVWTVDEKTTPELNRWQREILDILGIGNEPIFITRPTRFDRLHVPDAGYKYADWSHPQQIAFLASYDGPPQQDGFKLWLSRDPAHGRGVINREIIERKLRDLGWTIVTFEKMTVHEQLDALARAELIAGEEASTFHNLLLLKDVSSKRFQIFLRHGPAHRSFTTIGDARDVDQRFYSCKHDAVLFAQGRGVIRLAPNPAQYLSHLGIRIPNPSPDPARRHAAVVRQVNGLARSIGASTFLQLGSAIQQTFLGVKVEHRDIVDDCFDFDVRSYRGRGAQFYEVTLDQFLTWFAEDRRYDLVLLTGDRHWLNALESIRTVLARAAHDRTAVMVHGAEPLLEFALRYLHPELGSRVVGSKNPVLVIWQRPLATDRRPVSNRLIRRAVYRGDPPEWLVPKRSRRARLVDTLRSVGVSRARLTRLARWTRSRSDR